MADGDPVIQGQVNTGTTKTTVRNSSAGIGIEGRGKQGVFGLGEMGVWGQGIGQPGKAVGVLGEAEDGIGVEALGQGYGLGVWAMGGRAPLLLKPTITKGPPTSGLHEKGELMVDRKGDLYLCKKTGTPGTWKLIG
jgi:hypothetical protein